MNADMIVTADDVRRICASSAPAVGVVESEHPEQYGGVITETGGKVTGIYEKSSNPPGNLINAGIYLLMMISLQRRTALCLRPAGGNMN